MAEASRTRQLENEISAVNHQGTLLVLPLRWLSASENTLTIKMWGLLDALFFFFFLQERILIVNSWKTTQTRANSQIPFGNACQKMLSTHPLSYCVCMVDTRWDFLKKNKVFLQWVYISLFFSLKVECDGFSVLWWWGCRWQPSATICDHLPLCH